MVDVVEKQRWVPQLIENSGGNRDVSCVYQTSAGKYMVNWFWPEDDLAGSSSLSEYKTWATLYDAHPLRKI